MRDAPVLVRLLHQIASRFQIVVTEKVAAQAVPLAGAATGALMQCCIHGPLQHGRPIPLWDRSARAAARQADRARRLSKASRLAVLSAERERVEPRRSRAQRWRRGPVAARRLGAFASETWAVAAFTREDIGVFARKTAKKPPLTLCEVSHILRLTSRREPVGRWLAKEESIESTWIGLHWSRRPEWLFGSADHEADTVGKDADGALSTDSFES